MTVGTGSPRFRSETDLALGVEEELLLVEPLTRRLSHTGIEVLERMAVDRAEGAAHPDTYSALVELASPIVRDAGEAVAALSTLRARLRAAGGVAIGAGIHPDGAFGDVEHVDAPRYDRIVAQLRGLISRTPTCALHVHVGMPEAQTAIRALNGLREHLPVLQALAANSPFWHGRDSGLDSARAQLFRGYPRAEIPRAFASYEDYAETVASVVAAGDLPDYTFLWWDVRPHPRLGTVEVRAMDSQSSLWSAAGLAALVHGLARAAVEEGPGAPSTREALMEASFSAARDGLGARLPLDGSLRPAREVALAALHRARPHARELGSEDALAGIERILAEGNGADRQRAAFARGGMPALLDLLVAEAERPYT
ncbi:MAG: glutamate---cysteine ligase / carboxylate-amine ligase [Solirubrobacteraceae bacterium]|nr:glutamate---cysteine ligase / carboxylate-amine ligase [Solirubrobacteraceae bacterium]MEA2393231.1 glutamate---cysteine ligase / carboxylate-amine ligase [Solirubrobacteraceae bacterium]